ncbi:MAG: hypothetical protein LBB91_02850 [Clostridiales bacterium]|nr:hypothetical protein [Clostridiales bacterium]
MSDKFGDKVLYCMCEEKPHHYKDADAVEGKMWLIGRSYAASPERRQGRKLNGNKNTEKTQKTDSDFLIKIAERIADSSESMELDAKIKHMQGDKYSYNFDDDIDIFVKTIQLVELLNELVKAASNIYNNGERNAENNISFASKYLHFHLRHIVYLKDTYSYDNAQAKYPDVQEQSRIILQEFGEKLKGHYKEYLKHTIRCYFVAKELKKNGEDCSPRAVDNLLLGRK